MMSLTEVPARSGRPDRAGHVRQAAHHLHDLVERQRGSRTGRAGSPCARRRSRRGNSLRQRRVVEAELGHQAGAEVLEHHVALADQLASPSARPSGVLMSSTTLFLLRLNERKKPMPRPGSVARLVAARRLDLDDLGAEVGQDHSAGRAHHHVGELDDADAGQRQARCRSVRSLMVVLRSVSGQSTAAGVKVLGRPARQSAPCSVSPCEPAGHLGAQRQQPRRCRCRCSMPMRRA